MCIASVFFSVAMLMRRYNATEVAVNLNPNSNCNANPITNYFTDFTKASNVHNTTGMSKHRPLKVAELLQW